MNSVLPEKYKKVICQIADELNKHHINWVLLGSSNLRLQGIKNDDSDIDICTDQKGAELFEELFVDKMIKPVIYSTLPEQYRSYFGTFNFDGILVEVMGEFEIFDVEHKKWIEAINNKKIITRSVGNSIIFANTLDHELEMYRARGRIDKAQLIIKNFVEKFR